MPVTLPTLPNFPVSRENATASLQAMRNATELLQRQVADNFDPSLVGAIPPWVAVRRIRITGFTGLAAGWFFGRTQTFKPGGTLDPTVSLQQDNIYMDAVAADDCYVVAYEENGVPANLHRWKNDGSVYVVGVFKGYADIPSGSDLKRLPVFDGISRPTAMPLPCTLTNPTGSAGTNGPPPTAATYTYDIIDRDGNVVAAGASVWSSRQPGHVTPASKGLYFSDWDDSFKIIWCDEVIDTGACV